MAMYALRDLPDDLWTRLRKKALAERWPLRALILQLVTDYVDGRITPSAAPPPWDPAKAPREP